MRHIGTSLSGSIFVDPGRMFAPLLFWYQAIAGFARSDIRRKHFEVLGERLVVQEDVWIAVDYWLSMAASRQRQESYLNL